MSHTRMTTLTELIKDDKSHSFGACFHILVCRCGINFNVPSIFSSPEQRHGELLYYPWRWRQCWRPQMLKFSLKFLRSHYFLTLSPI